MSTTPYSQEISRQNKACFLFLLISSDSLARGDDKVNLLIITVDDMSADSIGAFGCHLPGTSPNIDRFAQESVVFEQGYVQASWTKPSMLTA